MEPCYQLVARGLCGWFGDAWYEGGHSSISAGAFGYADEPDASRYRIADGALVLDKSAVLEASPALSWKAPLPDARLSAGEIDRIDTRGSIVASALAGEPGNGFGALLNLAAAVRVARPALAGPLDRVSLADYAAWWRFHGARVGFWRGGRVEWEPEPERPEPLPGFPPAEPLSLDL